MYLQRKTKKNLALCDASLKGKAFVRQLAGARRTGRGC